MAYQPCVRSILFGLVGEVVLDAGDNANGFEVLVFLIAVFDGEESLISIFDFAEAGATIGCKLLSDLASLLGGFFNHLWFDLIELCEEVLRAGASAVIATRKRDTGLAKHGEVIEGSAYFCDVCCVNRYATVSGIAEFGTFSTAPLLGELIGDIGW